MKLTGAWIRFLIFARRNWWLAAVPIVFFVGLVYDLVVGFPKFKEELLKHGFELALGGLVGALVAWLGTEIKYLTDITDAQMEIDKDESDIILMQSEADASDSFRVDVKRSFTMVATTDGLYRFVRECKGEWHTGGCSVVDKRGHQLALDYQRTQSIIETDPIMLKRGDTLRVSLLSHEKIDFKRGHYSLRISSPVRQSELKWSCGNGESPHPRDIKGFLYSESFALLKVSHGHPETVRNASDGMTLLLVWEV